MSKKAAITPVAVPGDFSFEDRLKRDLLAEAARAEQAKVDAMPAAEREAYLAEQAAALKKAEELFAQAGGGLAMQGFKIVIPKNAKKE